MKENIEIQVGDPVEILNLSQGLVFHGGAVREIDGDQVNIGTEAENTDRSKSELIPVELDTLEGLDDEKLKEQIMETRRKKGIKWVLRIKD